MAFVSIASAKSFSYPPSLSSHADSVSWFLGVSFYETAKKQILIDGGKVNIPLLIKAIKASNKSGSAANTIGSETWQQSVRQNLHKNSKITSSNDTLNWVYGNLIARDLFNAIEFTPEQFDISTFSKGFYDQFENKETISASQIEKFMQAYMKAFQEKKAERERKIAEQKKKVAQKFLANNLKNDSIKSTESGLQYKVLKKGTGEKPSLSDRISVHYHGTLIDGTVFDSSVERGQPAQFGLSQVIKGWQEGLQMMQEGAKYAFYIPPHLGYGDKPAGKSIPAYSVLIFEVELIKIEP